MTSAKIEPSSVVLAGSIFIVHWKPVSSAQMKCTQCNEVTIQDGGEIVTANHAEYERRHRVYVCTNCGKIKTYRDNTATESKPLLPTD